MSTQDKLAEALRVMREWLNSDKWRNSTIDKHKSWEAMMRGIDAALAEHDARGAEAAQAQAQSGERLGQFGHHPNPAIDAAMAKESGR